MKLQADKKKVADIAPRTKFAKEEAQAGGKIYGWWKLPKGRPPGSKNAKKGVGAGVGGVGEGAAAEAAKASQPKFSMGTATKAPAGGAAPRGKKKKRGSYKSWNEGPRKEAKAAAIEAALLGNCPITAAREKCPGVEIPRQTLQSWVDKEKERRQKAANNEEPNKLGKYSEGLDKFDRHGEEVQEGVRGKKSLTDQAFRDDLQRIIQIRDYQNNGLRRKEVICMIADFYTVSMKTAENHYDYLITHKMLPELKRGGKVVSAQPTTTNRTAITTEKLLRNHLNFDVAMNQVRAMNGNSKEFEEVIDYFSLNLDESNFMACEGVLRIVGSAMKKKHEKNTTDSRESVTTVRVGSSAATEVSYNR